MWCRRKRETAKKANMNTFPFHSKILSKYVCVFVNIRQRCGSIMSTRSEWKEPFYRRAKRCTGKYATQQRRHYGVTNYIRHTYITNQQTDQLNNTTLLKQYMYICMYIHICRKECCWSSGLFKWGWVSNKQLDMHIHIRIYVYMLVCRRFAPRSFRLHHYGRRIHTIHT